MLVTVGYARLPLAHLDALLDHFKAELVDVRSKPVSRIPGYGGAQLAARYRARYLWKGDVLGGGPHVRADRAPGDLWPSGLPWLAAQRKPLLLLCLEEYPFKCHRHLIAVGLRRKVVHVVGDELVDARELERVLVEGRSDYRFATLTLG